MTLAPSYRITVVPLVPILIPGVLRVQYAAYDADLHETADSYRDKLVASPGTSFAATSCCARSQAPESEVVGYAVTLAVPRFFLPALDATSTAAQLTTACAGSAAHHGGQQQTSPHAHEPMQADTLYLHDVAVHPSWRGRGVAVELLARVEAARATMGLTRMALIAVRGADRFWSRVGFVAVPLVTLPDAVRRKLQGYGADAVYMEKTVFEGASTNSSRRAAL